MPNVTGLVVAITEAFPVDVPAGTHEGIVVPLGTIPCAFTCKMELPNLIVLHEKICDGGGIFDDTLPSGFVRLHFIIIPLSIIPWCGGEFGHWRFWERVLNLCLTLTLMIRLITNYETVYSSNG
jgi:hypothetical protein